MNVNFLGEALLGEDEAKRRLKRYLEALRMPDVECVFCQDYDDLFAGVGDFPERYYSHRSGPPRVAIPCRESRGVPSRRWS